MMVASGGDSSGGGGRCCMRWWQHNRNHYYHHHNHNGHCNGNSNGGGGGVGGGGRVVASGSVFCLVCFIIYGLIAGLYGWVILTPPFYSYESRGLPRLGCQDDNEGSWSIGVFFGHSPFSLKPIETADVWRNESAAWPVANPVITCASVSHSGFPSNFVADPFLFVQVMVYIADVMCREIHGSMNICRFRIV